VTLFSVTLPFTVRRTFRLARRADDTDPFGIATSPEQVYCRRDADPGVCGYAGLIASVTATRMS